MSSGGADRFSLTTDQYLEKYHVNTYLEDAVSQLLEHKEDNPRVVPASFLSDYFRSVVQGNHVLFREFPYIKTTPHNRAAFIRTFWKAFRHIGKNGDLLTVREYHSLICLLCPDFPFEPVQKTARIILMDDAMDCLISFADFLYAFQIQFYYEEFIEKLQAAYQAIQSGSYRPGQVVVVPTLSRPRQAPAPTGEGAGTNGMDCVDVHTFLEATLQIAHTSSHLFSCPSVTVVKHILSTVERVTFYGFLMALSKHDGANNNIGTPPEKAASMEETDQELNSSNNRPKSARPKGALTSNSKKL
ncbi:centriolar satellite-associated tubulin polyglutamylase complex regulator 1 [Nematostella vectensis]|uniref:centriolar satellite-associated tubulin polyglutamylase complex regulator 1 n=1 Tax=Nematostella vectensis TaxID=45351 RepID=UPI002076E615|nr:centriolar satellite-associated tubulin polyglutamylase complex regulator 1 [Nematostella vectensis]